MLLEPPGDVLPADAIDEVSGVIGRVDEDRSMRRLLRCALVVTVRAALNAVAWCGVWTMAALNDTVRVHPGRHTTGSAQHHPGVGRRRARVSGGQFVGDTQHGRNPFRGKWTAPHPHDGATQAIGMPSFAATASW